jgi:hypothetical protein
MLETDQARARWAKNLERIRAARAAEAAKKAEAAKTAKAEARAAAKAEAKAAAKAAAIAKAKEAEKARPAPAPALQSQAIDLPIERSKFACTWQNLELDTQCVWPIGNDMWCGNQKAVGSYCRHHNQLAHRAAPTERRPYHWRAAQ